MGFSYAHPRLNRTRIDARVHMFILTLHTGVALFRNFNHNREKTADSGFRDVHRSQRGRGGQTVSDSGKYVGIQRPDYTRIQTKSQVDSLTRLKSVNFGGHCPSHTKNLRLVAFQSVPPTNRRKLKTTINLNGIATCDRLKGPLFKLL